MEILRTIAIYTEDKDMPFLLIGGHAINHYGHPRQTGDIDLIVRADDKEQWTKLLIKLSYTVEQNDTYFARFKPDQIAAWPIDLMFINSETFKKLNDDALTDKLGAATIRIVSARHLATLKIHALKNYQEHRYAKDYNDLLLLLKSKQADFTDEELKELCLRYASKELYDKLLRELR